MKRFALVVLLAIAIVGVIPAVASAAAPVATGEMDVQLWPGAEPGQLLVIVGITLPETTKLPATVRLPFPEGMTLGWSGEISTATADGDIQAKAVTKSGKGGRYVEFELTKSRMAQSEFIGLALDVSGTEVKTEVKYVQTAAAGLTGFAVRLPATAGKVKIKPEPTAEPGRNKKTGELMYTLPSKQLKVGDSATIKVSYSTALPSTGGPSNTTTILLVLTGLVVLVAVVLGVVVFMQKRSAEGAAG